MNAVVLSWIVALGFAESAAMERPRALDARLTITLFAAEPDIVTPTGIAIDDQGRVLVVESHTHFRPKDYEGPPADRIRVFEDRDRDGKCDRVTTFFEGTRSTMNLAVHADGSVYVATRSEVFRLRDLDADGRSDEHKPIARLETAGDYPHNGLSGFAFDFAGNVYFGCGENLGADYKLIGAGGVTIAGGGEGGNIYRCRSDGSQLVHIATGFWNPFHLCFDVFGRLFAVDNDPDSRPPCRLLHIVEGGDYGYRYRNGRKGLHPFTAWNGELPGTLPMVAGTGEAPSGIVAYESDQLPDEYRGTLLATSWGDHRIDQFRLQEQGASFRSLAVPIVSGGEFFRPVGIAVAPDGTVFCSDWVDKSYDLHRKGRIWMIRHNGAAPRSQEDCSHRDRRIRERAQRTLAGQGASGARSLRALAATSVDSRIRATAYAALASCGQLERDAARRATTGAQMERDAAVRASIVRQAPSTSLDLAAIAASDESAMVRAEALRRLSDPSALAVARDALASPDPFVQQAAREGLKQSCAPRELITMARSPVVEQRMAALLNLRARADRSGVPLITEFLRDADARVQFCAIEWIGEDRLTALRTPLTEVLSTPAITQQLFEAVLAALERVDGVTRKPAEEWAGEEYVARLFLDPSTSSRVRRLALRMLRPDHPAISLPRLQAMLAQPDDDERLEAIRSLRESAWPERFDALAAVAGSRGYPNRLRAEAVMGLSAQVPAQRKRLVELATRESDAVQHEALRSLRGASLADEERDLLQSLADRKLLVRELVASVLQPAGRKRPAGDLDEWSDRLDGSADAAAGERIFFHPNGPGCYRCHQVHGRGGRIGPDLSRIALGSDRRRLLESIVQPSKEIAPQYVPWTIAKRDGAVAVGLFIGETLVGEHMYADSKGQVFRLRVEEIDERRPQTVSIMPDDVMRTLTELELGELLAFLATLQ